MFVEEKLGMSFIISIYTNEGLVMAADSRLTLTVNVGPKESKRKISFDFSNSTQKLFVTKSNVGISTCGDAGIQGKPIAGYIEAFIAKNQEGTVDDTALKLLEYFRVLKPDLRTTFHVAGYAEDRQQKLFRVSVADNSSIIINDGNGQGAAWDGEVDVLTRILKDTWISDQAGKPVEQLSNYPIPWEFFSLQDAIDFAIFAMSATIGAIRFQNRLKTVGGPIDILVIKPDQSLWVQKKQLHGETVNT